MMSLLQTPADILDEAVLYLRVYFVGFPFLFMYNILSTMFTSIGESKIPLGLLIFSSVLKYFMDLWMVAGLGLGVFGAALATLIAQGISAVFSLLIFFSRMRRYKSHFDWFDGQELHSHASNCCTFSSSAVYSVNWDDDRTGGCKSIWYTGTCGLFGNDESRECFFTDICIHWKCSFTVCFPESWCKENRNVSKKGYHAALVLDLCFAVLAFIVIETLHTQISSLFLGKDGTALAYQVSGDYMRWLGYFFHFYGYQDGNRWSPGWYLNFFVGFDFCPRFGIAFVWLGVPAGWLANFLISYAALRKLWPIDKVDSI